MLRRSHSVTRIRARLVVGLRRAKSAERMSGWDERGNTHTTDWGQREDFCGARFGTSYSEIGGRGGGSQKGKRVPIWKSRGTFVPGLRSRTFRELGAKHLASFCGPFLVKIPARLNKSRPIKRLMNAHWNALPGATIGTGRERQERFARHAFVGGQHARAAESKIEQKQGRERR
jgi:hypothetical protein